MNERVVGGVTLNLLLDAHTSIEGDKAFFPAQADEWSPGFEVDAGGAIPNVVQSLLIRDGDELTLVDTGFGEEEMPDRRESTIKSLAECGVQPKDISRVILTHAHGDHCMGNTLKRRRRWLAAFPLATYIVQASEVASLAAAQSELWLTRFEPIDSRGQLQLVDGQVVISETLELWPTPGHTVGHQSVIIRSRSESAVFVGDLAIFAASFLHDGWGPDWAWSREADNANRAAVADWAVSNDALVIVPHDPVHSFVRFSRSDGRLVLVSQP